MEKTEKNNQQPDNNAINKGENRVGRANHDETHDISHVDQQEGAMDNGAVGGNFKESPSIEEMSQGRESDQNK